MNLETLLNKETIDKIGNSFYQSHMYPLTNLDTPLQKEINDKIGNTFYWSISHVPIDEFRYTS